jgi:hypothetical protein
MIKASSASRLPPRLRKLKRDSRGQVVVPWWIAWDNGAPQYGKVGEGKARDAVRFSWCWTCGETLGRFKAFTIKPDSVITRMAVEPPSHLDCALFMVQQLPPGSGVICVWVLVKIELFNVKGGAAFRLTSPETVLWLKDGRTAPKADVEEAIQAANLLMQEAADKKGPEAVEALHTALYAALRHVPEEK